MYFLRSRKTPFAPSRVSLRARLCLTLSLVLLAGCAFAETPGVSSKAPDFTLNTPTGSPIRLSEQQQGKPLVLVFLRGYPGYQCPYCQRQVHDFITHASDFAARQAKVLLVYPGPPAALDDHARAFLAGQAALPPGIVLVTDPDYTVTNLYGLRWKAPNETAYPSTFIVDNNGVILFAKVSHGHDDRVSARQALTQLPSR